MQNSKNFGLSDSLIEAVKEALHPNQKKLDKNKNGKLDADDFKKLRGEGAKPDFLDIDKGGNKKEPMKQAAKQANEEAEQVDEKVVSQAQQKAARAALATQRGEYDAGKKGGAINRMALMKKKDLQKIAKGKTKKEEVAEADEQDPVAKQIAAKKEQMKKQIQQKIAQKQMSVMQQKAQKKIQSIKASTHDDMENDMKKKGKDTVEVDPELREAEDLPKKVIKKGHEIAKSLIKHKADVKEPYAVGMAQAKKSAG